MYHIFVASLHTGKPPHSIHQDIVLAATNTFEGALFIDPTTASTVQVPTYLSQLFPNFGAKEIAAATAQYSGLGSPSFQVTAIMGEGKW
jgi:cholinesterase